MGADVRGAAPNARTRRPVTNAANDALRTMRTPPLRMRGSYHRNRQWRPLANNESPRLKLPRASTTVDLSSWNCSVSARMSDVSASWLSGSILSTSRQMLSASPGSFKRRYRSAFASALVTASGEMAFSSNSIGEPPLVALGYQLSAIRLRAEHPEQIDPRSFSEIHQLVGFLACDASMHSICSTVIGLLPRRSH